MGEGGLHANIRSFRKLWGSINTYRNSLFVDQDIGLKEKYFCLLSRKSVRNDVLQQCGVM